MLMTDAMDRDGGGLEINWGKDRWNSNFYWDFSDKELGRLIIQLDLWWVIGGDNINTVITQAKMYHGLWAVA